MGGRKWTERELEAVVVGYKNAPPLTFDMTILAGRSHEAITLRGSRMGLGNINRPKVKERKRRRKYATAEERREALSASRKAWLSENQHPRGMLGKKHTPEALKRVGEGVRRAYSDPNNGLNSPTARANRANLWRRRYNGATPTTAGEKMYSRAAHGRRTDLNNRYFRSSWEANYARYLNFMMARGEIASWDYECHTFWFEKIKRGTRAYTPDFKVMFPDGHHEWHEVKGWMDPKSKTRLDRMRRYYPAEVIRVIDEKRFRQAARGGLAACLPGWERRGRGSRGC